MLVLLWIWVLGEQKQSTNTSEYYNNVFHDFYNAAASDSVGGIALWFRGTWKSAKAYNNTFVNLYQGIRLENSQSVTVKNNIFANCTNTAVYDGVTGGGLINSNNLFYGNAANYGGNGSGRG